MQDVRGVLKAEGLAQQAGERKWNNLGAGCVGTRRGLEGA